MSANLSLSKWKYIVLYTCIYLFKACFRVNVIRCQWYLNMRLSQTSRNQAGSNYAFPLAINGCQKRGVKSRYLVYWNFKELFFPWWAAVVTTAFFGGCKKMCTRKENKYIWENQVNYTKIVWPCAPQRNGMPKGHSVVGSFMAFPWPWRGNLRFTMDLSSRRVIKQIWLGWVFRKGGEQFLQAKIHN